ncbi:MAG: hypothetical protein N2235_10620 [Fischerella sp.]|nr:hypothetical protein [Fischerella sp.]
MKILPDGQVVYSETELLELLYQRPDLDLKEITTANADFYRAAKHFHLPWTTKNINADSAIDPQWYKKYTNTWIMPEEYKNLDIAKWCLDQCKTDAERQRVGAELLLYQERNLFPLLQFLKYFVDTLRKNKVVWGVGRGSSVASYVLYLIGVHRINSMYYDLDIREFLK